MDTSELLTRGVSDVVPRKVAEEKLKSGKKMRLYWGIDPTGAQIHLGHSVPLRKMRAFQDAGHHVILLIGSFTAMIGDPSGRDEMRQALSAEEVKKNFETYIEQAKKILDMKKLEVRYNHEWLEKLQFDEIIKLASHFTVQQMLSRDMFKSRFSYKLACRSCGYKNFLVEKWPDEETRLRACINCNSSASYWGKEILDPSPISLHEFMYPLMVGYDSVMLDVDVELGGNDQLFNMLAGRTLQTAFKKRDKFVLTTKLIEGTDGRKMSKTYNNCIYLTDSAKDMYGKTMSIKDELIFTYFECCTDIPMKEIKKMESDMKGGANPKEFKMKLAEAIVNLYYGKKEAQKMDKEFREGKIEKQFTAPSSFVEADTKEEFDNAMKMKSKRANL